jgi:hypothetical protein
LHLLTLLSVCGDVSTGAKWSVIENSQRWGQVSRTDGRVWATLRHCLLWLTFLVGSLLTLWYFCSFRKACLCIFPLCRPDFQHPNCPDNSERGLNSGKNKAGFPMCNHQARKIFFADCCYRYWTCSFFTLTKYFYIFWLMKGDACYLIAITASPS